MFRYLCPAAISKTHSCPHFLMKPLLSVYFLYVNFVVMKLSLLYRSVGARPADD